MDSIMQEYCELVGFLGKVLGQDYEVVLHDLSNMDNSVVAVANGHVSGRKIGSPMNENGLRLIRTEAWKQNQELIRYRGYSKKTNHLLCFTRFIKNQQGDPIGMLCINYDYASNQKLVDSISEQLGIAELPDQAESEKIFRSDTEKFPDSMEEVVYAICNQVMLEVPVPVDRLSQDEKIAIVEKLEAKGVFLFKGAVTWWPDGSRPPRQRCTGIFPRSTAPDPRTACSNFVFDPEWIHRVKIDRNFTKAESRGVYDTRIQQHGQQYNHVAGLRTGSIDRVVPGISLLPA